LKLRLCAENNNMATPLTDRKRKRKASSLHDSVSVVKRYEKVTRSYRLEHLLKLKTNECGPSSLTKVAECGDLGNRKSIDESFFTRQWSEKMQEHTHHRQAPSKRDTRTYRKLRDLTAFVL
jgi:hypothetical protein